MAQSTMQTVSIVSTSPRQNKSFMFLFVTGQARARPSYIKVCQYTQSLTQSPMAFAWRRGGTALSRSCLHIFQLHL